MKVILIIFFVGCSHIFKKSEPVLTIEQRVKKAVEAEDLPPSPPSIPEIYQSSLVGKVITPYWFTMEQTSNSKKDKTSRIHPFFDPQPEINLAQREVNFIVVTPAESEVQLALDLSSGAFYAQQKLCPQKDVWRYYQNEIFQNPFTIGLVPRVLDQLGDPQKIYVFGRPDYYQKLAQGFVHRTKVIGSVIEQYCPTTPCIGEDRWLSRMILFAVDPLDPLYAKVNTIDDLKNIVDWGYIKAFIENGFGRHYVNGQGQPAYRVIGNMKAKFSLDYTLKKNHQMNSDQLKKIHQSCSKLYEFFWQKISPIYPENAEQTKFKADLKSSFAKEFLMQLKKHGKRLATCSEFVAPGLVEDNPERFWFYAHLFSFLQLEKLNQYYHCSKKSWLENLTSKESKLPGKLLFDNRLELKKCSVSELDLAFSQSIEKMISLKHHGKEHFRFIDFDNHAFGTHQKLYSWIKVLPTELACGEGPYSFSIFKNLPVFPEDIQWKSFVTLNSYYKPGTD